MDTLGGLSTEELSQANDAMQYLHRVLEENKALIADPRVTKEVLLDSMKELVDMFEIIITTGQMAAELELVTRDI